MTECQRGVCEQVATLWPAAEQATAAAICCAESGGDPAAHCLNCAGVSEDSRGVFQVNLDAHPEFVGWDLYDPMTNARAAFQIWQSSGWSAWTTYRNGSYHQYLAPTGGGAVTSPPRWLVPAILGIAFVLAIT